MMKLSTTGGGATAPRVWRFDNGSSRWGRCDAARAAARAHARKNTF